MDDYPERSARRDCRAGRGKIITRRRRNAQATQARMGDIDTIDSKAAIGRVFAVRLGSGMTLSTLRAAGFNEKRRGYEGSNRTATKIEGAGFMITGAINSLIWILVLIAIVAVVIAVVRAVSAPRTERPVERPVVEQQPVVQQQPIAGSGLAPGWYPDQQDMNMMRYFDGRVWTAQTEPRR